MSESPRTLHLLPHQGVGGLQRFVIEFVRHERMDRAGDEIVLTERPLDVDRDFLAPATPVHFLGLLGASPRARGRRLADLATSRGARVIHAYTASDLAIAEIARRRAPGLALVATLFEPPPEEPGRLARLLDPRAKLVSDALSAANEVFVPTPALGPAWRALGREPEVLPLPVDTQRFSPQERSSSWRSARLPDPGTLLVGTLMRAEDGMNHDALADAVERRSARGAPTALMMVGDGPRLDERKARAKGSDVIFARRRVLDTPAFFAQIDVFARHARHELAPISLIESMSCGRAALVADPGEVQQLAGSDGAMFTAPGDVDAIVEALDALADPTLRRRLGDAGRERAVATHGLGRARARVRRAYGQD